MHAVFALVAVLWALYGYSLAFTTGNAFIGGWDRCWGAGLTDSALGATFTKGVVHPGTRVLRLPGRVRLHHLRADRRRLRRTLKFSGVLLFTVLWFTFAYTPMAHMVWFFPGPDAFTDE